MADFAPEISPRGIGPDFPPGIPLVKSISHIDALNIQRWLPELLDLKGILAKPQEIDLGQPVQCVVDLTQGGFANEEGKFDFESGAEALDGNVVFSITLLDLRLSNEPAPTKTARIHSLTARTAFNQAGALSHNQRRIQMYAELDQPGKSIKVGMHETGVSTNKQNYVMNVNPVWPGYVPTNFRLRMFWVLQADYSGGGGSPDFPAGTDAEVWCTYTKKAEGGQLPI